MDRKDIALTVGGVIASAGVAFLIYRLQQRDAAQNAAAISASQDNTAQTQSAYLTALPSVSIPQETSSASFDTNSPVVQTPTGVDPNLEAIIASFLGQPGPTGTQPVQPIVTGGPVQPIATPIVTGGPVAPSIPITSVASIPFPTTNDTNFTGRPILSIVGEQS
jgi:hypothetical protein